MISSARIHEGSKLIPLIESISIETTTRPRKRPKTIYADTKYAMPLNRFYLDKKNYRKITISYERMPQMLLALVYLACILILWRVMK
jgi:hypothetical protein